MAAFKGLLKKDFLLSKSFFLSILTIMGIGLIMAIGLARYYQSEEIFGIISVSMVLAHLFYIPGALLTSLQMEGKTQLWLHNPTSSWKLLLSKITINFIYYLLSISVIFIIAAISLSISKNTFHYFSTSDLFLMSGSFFLISLYMSAWIIFYWTFFHSLGRYYRLKKYRWIVILLCWNGWNLLGYLVNKLRFVQEMKEFGMLHFGNSLQFTGNSSGFEASMGSIDISVVALGSKLLIVVCLFLISSWLLDKKVEV